jgi:tRNA-dihydrouridine synthase 1
MSEAEIEKAAKKKRKKDKKDKKHKKEKKSSKKRKKLDSNSSPNIEEPCHKRSKGVENNLSNLTGELNFPIQYVLARMVGASELPFRILCRKYGAQACYTPMMSSTKFASDPKYREEEFQTIKEDRPLVCHFSANDPKEFTEAAKLVQDKCDAIDLK